MRFAEGLQWLSADRIAVRGSINPSQSQYYVFDTRTGTQVGDIVDDDSAAAFSPDGLHVASISGSPHFSDQAARKPVLSVDDHAVFPTTGGNVEFLSGPVWSSDGKAVAIAARATTNVSPELVVWTGGVPQTRSAPFGATGRVSLFWSKAQLVAVTLDEDRNRAWSIDPKTLAFHELNAGAAATEYERATQHRNGLARKVSVLGLSEPDFWCSACDLTLLPRGTE
jgi:hypothetical protein